MILDFDLRGDDDRSRRGALLWRAMILSLSVEG
jgi:hypothetical protein